MDLVGPFTFQELAAAVDPYRRYPTESLWPDEQDFLRVMGPLVDEQRGVIRW